MNNTPLHQEAVRAEILRKMLDEAPIRTGAIPKDTYSFLDPRMPVFASKPDWEIEVDFND
jgi:hypothetical protein